MEQEDSRNIFNLFIEYYDLKEKFDDYPKEKIKKEIQNPSKEYIRFTRINHYLRHLVLTGEEVMDIELGEITDEDIKESELYGKLEEKYDKLDDKYKEIGILLNDEQEKVEESKKEIKNIDNLHEKIKKLKNGENSKLGKIEQIILGKQGPFIDEIRSVLNKPR
ncbi:hypothetical protein CMI40_00725 [Candidatus Pacearchaeota archaeon]|jgi:hypothetical protein|nr:hypothetical protein [Candidatus Pacearchaeota archaeon]|tara:strand:+ start:12799 stop:13290 length:492 start_codon:yes stop_codon:yes gene_type:complete